MLTMLVSADILLVRSRRVGAFRPFETYLPYRRL